MLSTYHQNGPPNGNTEISILGSIVETNAVFSTIVPSKILGTPIFSAISGTAVVLTRDKGAYGISSQPSANSVITALGLMASVIVVPP